MATTFDPHKNLAISTVLTAPSPATSGNTVVLQSGHGARFPDPVVSGAFNLSVFPAGGYPDPSTAEIWRCTARSTDTLTIARAQEGTTARSVAVSDIVVMTVTAKSLTDIEGALFDKSDGVLTGVTSPVYAAGKLVYDTTAGNDALTFMNAFSGVSQQLGYEHLVRVRNNTGASIPNGSVVYVNGAAAPDGYGVPTVALARADAAGTYVVLGVTTMLIPNTGYGLVTRLGIIHGLDTSAFAQGAVVYLSSTTAGGLTATAPSPPNYRMRVGVVLVSNATTGSILINPYLLDDPAGAAVYKDLYFSGTLTIKTGLARIIVPSGNWTLAAAKGVVVTANTGASILVDVNKNGTTVFTTQTNRLTIPVSTTTVQTSGTPEVSSLTGGDVLSVDIDQIGSTIAGADLSVMLTLMKV